MLACVYKYYKISMKSKSPIPKKITNLIYKDRGQGERALKAKQARPSSAAGDEAESPGCVS